MQTSLLSGQGIVLTARVVGIKKRAKKSDFHIFKTDFHPADQLTSDYLASIKAHLLAEVESSMREIRAMEIIRHAATLHENGILQIALAGSSETNKEI